MTEEIKKISFGFSKLKKPNNLVKRVEVSKPEVDYVDSFDGVRGKFSYKGNVKCDEPVKKELVIPLIGTKSAFEVIKAKLEAIQENNQNSKSNTDLVNPDSSENKEVVKEDKVVTHVEKKVSINDLAVREILNDLQNNVTEEKSKTSMVIKQPSHKLIDEKETVIDYENVPVVDFGLAMLRGMGWTPQTGIGKEQKVVQVITPKLRPKGMGLGADKVVLKEAVHDPELTISIKSYVKFMNGSYKGSYGKVQAMDDSNGRVIVKLALGGSVSVSEMLLIPVTKKDYEKNSKVLNPTKYDNFRDFAESETTLKKINVSSDKNERTNRHRKEKYDRRHLQGHKDKDDVRKNRQSSSGSSERSSRQKKKKSRGGSRERKDKKTKKKRKKRKKYSSENSDGSDDGRYKRERSRENSHHHKRKCSSRR